MAEIADRGASTARDLDDGLPRDKKDWGWNWSATKRALDYLYMVGEVAIAGRNSQFEVRYDLPERVLPADVLAAPTPTLDDANRELVRRAARSHGVATARCLADYYRMRLQPGAGNRAAQGRHRGPRRGGRAGPGADRGLEPAGVPPSRRPPAPPRRRPGAAEPVRPGGVAARAHRAALRLPLPDRDLHARAHQRIYGYYVLPFLLGDEIVGRVDLKADRQSGRLVVKAAYAEPGAPGETAEELSAELVRLASWLGMERAQSSSRRGDLAPLLRL